MLVSLLCSQNFVIFANRSTDVWPEELRSQKWNTPESTNEKSPVPNGNGEGHVIGAKRHVTSLTGEKSEVIICSGPNVTGIGYVTRGEFQILLV